MPEKATLRQSRQAKRAGRSPGTQAGPFVREEIHHVREGKHGARSTKQIIAIGLSKARRAGVRLPPPPATATRGNRRSATSSRPASRKALSRQAKSAAPRAARTRKRRRRVPA
jgi:hypothetical protein